MRHEQHIIDAVRRMKGDGVGNAEIAMAVGLTEGSVKSLCKHRRIRRPSSGRLALPLGAVVMDVYRAEASRREVPFDRFMRKLLATIAKDNLFVAILDDGK